ncbi:MAG: hypothetical protein R3B93_09385 [Bacteroidia bacterium]
MSIPFANGMISLISGKYGLKTQTFMRPTSPVEYFVNEETWAGHEAFLIAGKFPRDYISYLKFLFWYKREDHFEQVLTHLIEAYHIFYQRELVFHNVEPQIQALKYVLGFLDQMPEGADENSLHYLREKIHGRPYLQNLALIRRRIIRDIFTEVPEGFDRWLELIKRDQNVFQDLEKKLRGYHRPQMNKDKERLFIRKMIALNARKEPVVFSEKMIENISEKLKPIPLKVLIEIQNPEDFQYVLEHYQSNATGVLEDEVKLMNLGASATQVQTLSALPYGLSSLIKNIHVVPLVAGYIDLVQSLSISEKKKKEIIREIDIEDFLNFDPKAERRISDFVAAIRNIMHRLADEEDPFLHTFLDEIPQMIFSISKRQIKELSQWQKKSSRIQFSHDLQLPEYLEFIRNDLEELGHHLDLVGIHQYPKAILSLFHQKEKLEKQIAYLENKMAESPDSDLSLRLENLYQQKEDFETIHANQVRKKIDHSLQAARIQSLKNIIQNITYQQLQELVHAPDRLLEENQVNTLLLFIRFFLSTGEKDKLKKLVETYIEYPDSYKLKYEANHAWLKQAAEAGVNTKTWLKPIRKEVDSSLGKLLMYESTNPLEIFLMGYYFDTCLSIRDGMNRDAVVKNATDVNKKVIFARDSKGTVIGRKLIGISLQYRLIGFETYVSTSSKDKELKNEIQLLFDHFCQDQAEKANIPLSNHGKLAEINEGFWYFDGLVNFDNQFFRKEDLEKSFGDASAYHAKHFPYHPYFLQYFFHHREEIEAYCLELGVDPPDLGQSTPELYEYITELCLRQGAKTRDRDFLIFAIEHISRNLKRDAVFEWAMLMGDEALPHIEHYMEDKDERLVALWWMNTPNSRKEFYRLVTSVDWGLFSLSNGFFRLCGKEIQKEIIQAIYNVHHAMELDYGVFYGVPELDVKVAGPNLFRLIEKYVKIYPPSYNYFEDILNVLRTIFHNTIIPRSEELTADAKQLTYLIELSELAGLGSEKSVIKELERFLSLHPNRVTTTYFKKKMAEANEFTVDRAVIYLSFYQYHSRFMGDHLMDKLPDTRALKCILFSGNQKLIEKGLRKIKNKGYWNDEIEKIRLIFSYMRDDNLEKLKEHFDKTLDEEGFYPMYLLDYFRRKGCDHAFADLLVEWQLKHEYRFARVIYPVVYQSVKNREIRLKLLHVHHPNTKADPIFDFLADATLDEVTRLKESFEKHELKIHLNPDWHIYKQKQINPEYIQLLRPLFYNVYWPLYVNGDFNREKGYIMNYPIAEENLENFSPLRKMLVKDVLE